MTKGRLICVIGIDGSGKTTHAKKLLSYLQKCGKKSKYTWLRSSYFFSYPFMALCRLLNFTKIQVLPGGYTYIKHQYSSKPIACVWPWIRLVDLIINIIARVYLPLWQGFCVVCDRFIHDILVDISDDVNNPQVYRRLVGKLMLKLIPRNTIVFLLDTDETTAFNRKNDLPDSKSLVIRKELYHSIATYLRIPVIDSTMPIKIVHESLVNLVKDHVILPCVASLDEVKIRLYKRLKAKAIRRKIKKSSALAKVRRLIKVISYTLYGVHTLNVAKSRCCLDLGVDEFGRDVTQGLLDYTELLKRRGLNVHSVIVVGSRAKGRWKPESDVDTIVVVDNVPKGFKKRSALTDRPLFLGIKPEAYTKEEFLEKLMKLDLVTLDAIYHGKIIYDDGFWPEVKEAFKHIEEKYKLMKAAFPQIRARISEL